MLDGDLLLSVAVTADWSEGPQLGRRDRLAVTELQFWPSFNAIALLDDHAW